MIRYTDVPITITVNGVDISTATGIHVTIKQGDVLIDTTDVEVSEKKITLTLNQQQTGKLRDNYPAEIQVNFFIDDLRYATDVKTINVKKQLLNKVLS